jgi:non-specific protein-tyrosine kinase
LLVVRYGKTRREQVRRAADALRAVDANIYGIVLNMAPAKGPDAYYYGYAYRYDYRPVEGVDIRPATTKRYQPDQPTAQPATEPKAPATAASPSGTAEPDPLLYPPSSTVRVHPGSTYEDNE